MSKNSQSKKAKIAKKMQPVAKFVDGLRQRAEKMIARTAKTSSEELAALSPEDSRRLLYELRLVQFELELHNDELRRVQLEVEIERERYFDLYNLAPVGYCTLDRDGMVLEANLTAVQLLGLTGREQFVNQPIFTYIDKHFQDDFYLLQKQLFATGEKQVCELQLVKPDKTRFWGKLDSTLSRDTTNKDVCQLILSDVSIGKQAEEKRNLYLALLNAALESTGDGILIVDNDGQVLKYNNRFAEMWRIPAEVLSLNNDGDLLKAVLDQLLLPEEFLGKVRELYTQPETISNDVIILTEGRIFERYSQPQKIDAEIIGRIWSFRDITERTNAERLAAEKSLYNKSLLDALPNMLFILDDNGIFLDYQTHHVDELALPPEQFLGKSIFETLPEFLAMKIQSNMAEVFRGEKVRSFDYVLPVASQLQFFHCQILPFGGEKVIAVITNITDRKLDEAQLEKMESYGSFFETNSNLLCIAGTDGLLQKINNAWSATLGYPVAELQGKNFLDYIHPDDLALTREKMAVLEKGDEVTKFINRYRCSDGSYRFLEWYAQKDGALIYGSARDVTERLLMEKKLLESEEQFRKMFERHSAPMLIIDPANGSILDANRAAVSFYGWTLGQLRQMNISQVNAIPPAEVLEKLAAVAKNSGMKYEFVHRLMDGTLRNVEVFPSLVKIKNRELVFSVIHDVTDRVCYEQQLRETNELLRQTNAEALELTIRAEAANAAKSSFVANISHEIRTPMNGILGFVDLLSETEITAEQSEMIQIIKTATDSLLSVVNDVLDVSKIEAGAVELESIPFDLRGAIENAVNPLAAKSVSGSLVFNLVVRPDVPQFVVGDPVRLKQVLGNLVNNAFKFTEVGEVVVDVKLLTIKADSCTIKFSVRDTGIGIAPEALGKLFRPFHQVDSSTTRKYGGSGLGLAICKSLIEAMGGEIEVESQLGVGTKFSVVLPLAIDSAQIVCAPVDYRALQSKTFLVVDDDANNRKIAKTYLQEAGATVVEAENAMVVLGKIFGKRQPKFHAILIDYEMPGMSGYDLAYALQAIPATLGIPLVLLTSAGSNGTVKSLHEHGFSGCLSKPYKRRELLNCVCKVITGEADTMVGRSSLSLQVEQSVDEFDVNLKILLAEDDQISRSFFVRKLQRNGLNCDVAVDGAVAVELCRKTNYDLIFMDCQMPNLDGYQATKQIRDLEKQFQHRATIVALTAFAMTGDEEKCKAAGMDEYLSKPIAVAKLMQIIRRKSVVTAKESPGYSLAELNERLMISREFDSTDAAELLEIGIVLINTDFATAEAAFGSGQLQSGLAMLHKIKGSAANIGLPELATLATAGEQAANAGDIINLKKLLAEMRLVIAALPEGKNV
ncbi:MAG: PAS domain S-box protein [Bacillota bacterium]